MKDKTIALLLLYLACVLLAGCGGALATERLRWRTIGEGKGWNKDDWHGNVDDLVYIGEEPRLLIIDDPLAVPSLKFRVHARDLERVTRTDFSRFWVAVIYQGLRHKEGHVYSTQVHTVKLQDNTIYIQAEFQDRYTGKMAQGSPTPSPYYVLRIKKPAGMESEPVFVLNTGTRIVPQLCAISGEYVPWEPIAGDPECYSPNVGPSPRLVIIQTPDEAPSDHPPSYYSPATGINLRTHFGVVAYQGEGASGHAIDVISVKRQDDSVLVCAQFIAPSKGPQDVRYPYYLFQIERIEELHGKITPFLLLNNGTEVAREVAVIR